MSEISIFPCLLLLYALAVGTSAWFVMRAERRQQLQQRIKSMSSGLAALRIAALSGPRRGSALFCAKLVAAGVATAQYIRRHKKAAFIGAALLLLPTLFALLSASHALLDGYGDPAREMDPVVVALLQGERLVPPPPLPPEVFATQEITAEGTRLVDANREWQLLDADFRQRLLTVYRLMAVQGYQMALIEGYRSPERQAVLASYGPHVTRAGAYQSYHQYGLAADSAFYRNGKIVISEKDPWAMEGYWLFGEYAESAGLVWGGRWKMMDFGHVEMHKARISVKN
jgi:peptidoglycan L-alanyl-D-glutamate endopeptidase CwlK